MDNPILVSEIDCSDGDTHLALSSCYTVWKERYYDAHADPNARLVAELLRDVHLLTIDGVRHVFCEHEVGWKPVDSYQAQEYLSKRFQLYSPVNYETSMPWF